MTDTLSRLFGSKPRVKLLRLFLFNPHAVFTSEEAAKHARVQEREAVRELVLFAKLKLLSVKRNKKPHYSLNPAFPYSVALQNLFLNASTYIDDLPKRLHDVGILKLVVAAGVFVGEWGKQGGSSGCRRPSREERLEKAVRLLEAEIGREVRYALLSTQEFLYRLNMSDHLVRDVLDYNHRVVVDRLDIGLK